MEKHQGHEQLPDLCFLLFWHRWHYMECGLYLHYVWVYVLTFQFLVKYGHLVYMSVSWKTKLSKSEPISRIGKTISSWYQGETLRLPAKPSGVLPICFPAWNILFSSRLKQPSGIYSIYLKTANIFIISTLFGDHNLLNAMNNHISHGLLWNVTSKRWLPCW